MKRKRYSEAQILGFLKEAGSGIPVKALCRKHGFSDASFYNWRSKYGGMELSDMKRLKALEAENSRLKKLLAETMLDKEALESCAEKKVLTPQAKREAVLEMQSETTVSQRQACQLVGLARSTLRYEPRRSLADEQLLARIIELAQERRRFGYRRIHALLRREGYEINHKRTYRLYRASPSGGTQAQAPQGCGCCQGAIISAN